LVTIAVQPLGGFLLQEIAGEVQVEAVSFDVRGDDRNASISKSSPHLGSRAAAASACSNGVQPNQ
jgi:hypothetical protein